MTARTTNDTKKSPTPRTLPAPFPEGIRAAVGLNDAATDAEVLAEVRRLRGADERRVLAELRDRTYPTYNRDRVANTALEELVRLIDLDNHGVEGGALLTVRAINTFVRIALTHETVGVDGGPWVGFRVSGTGLVPTFSLEYQLPVDRKIPPTFEFMPVLTDDWRPLLPPVTPTTAPVLFHIGPDRDETVCTGSAGYAVAPEGHPSATVRYLAATPPYAPVAGATTTTKVGYATIEGLPPGATYKVTATRDQCAGSARGQTAAGAVWYTGAFAR